MRQNLTLLAVGLGVFGLLVQSCSSSSSDGGAVSGAGTGGTAHSGAGGSGTAARAGGGTGGTSTGGGSARGGAGDATSGGETGGTEAGGALGGSGAGDMAGAAGLGVAETACTKTADCLPVCERNGWPEANCFGYCLCKSTTGNGPTCKIGTTEGCPTGTQCYGGAACMPYGTAVDGDKCDLGDECAVGYTCVGYGNPLPNGEYSSCRHRCTADQPLPADCYSCTSGIYCDPWPAGAAGAGN